MKFKKIGLYLTVKAQRIVKLIPPCFSDEYIKEKVICIRSHRERIFRVATEMYDNKLICHNYGQGGAGWTFLFGCVNESIRQFEDKLSQNEEFETTKICVIGAGCYGLLTAVLLARKGYSVYIVAQDTENIPSNKAAGFFFPRHRKCSTPEEIAIFKSMGMESYLTYLQIFQNRHSFIKKGPKLLPAYFGLDIDPGFGPYIAEGIMSLPEQVLIDFGYGKSYEAMEYKTIFINSSEIMQELWRNINELGIKITQATIDTFADIPETIIFNCAGLGAKKLADDRRIVPVQGHLISLKNQSEMANLQYMLNFKVTMINDFGIARDELIYYAPKESGILGITFIRGQDSLTANQHEFDRLLRRCKDFFCL